MLFKAIKFAKWFSASLLFLSFLSLYGTWKTHSFLFWIWVIGLASLWAWYIVFYPANFQRILDKFEILTSTAIITLIISVVCVAICVFARILFQPPLATGFLTLGMCILCPLALAVPITGLSGVAVSQVKKNRKALEEANQQLSQALAQTKELRGMLPICASCKKIRDDKGYWNRIESYIQGHSKALFTHGICPECIKRLYPDDNF
ncbi:MAG: hypothetical protein HZB36_03400 [Candidatus Omnitrophica bacterium]|nr:hypothetical protein [Candidatus Omnitrophota bacterium]